MTDRTFDYDKFRALAEEAGFEGHTYLDRAFPTDPWPRDPSEKDLEAIVDVVSVDLGDEVARTIVNACKI